MLRITPKDKRCIGVCRGWSRSGVECIRPRKRELRGYTDQLGALLLELHLQASLDGEEHQQKEEELIRSWPGRLKSDGYERVRIVRSCFKTLIKVIRVV
jgi:hypothetical protein